MIISKSAMDEYLPKLQELHDDDSLLEKEEKRVKGLRGVIKESVNDIADKVGSETERVELPGFFDRQVRRLGGGLDANMLELEVGTLEYQKLFCNRIVTYEFDANKFDAARKLGKIDDDTISKCMVEPKLSKVVLRVK